MNPKAATFVCGVILIFALTSIHLPAQDSGTVSGTVTDPAGKPVPNAKVSIKDATNGQSSEAQTDSAGHYTFSNLAAGDYQVFCSVEGIGQIFAKVTVATGDSPHHFHPLPTRVGSSLSSSNRLLAGGSV